MPLNSHFETQAYLILSLRLSRKRLWSSTQHNTLAAIMQPCLLLVLSWSLSLVLTTELLPSFPFVLFSILWWSLYTFFFFIYFMHFLYNLSFCNVITHSLYISLAWLLASEDKDHAFFIPLAPSLMIQIYPCLRRKEGRKKEWEWLVNYLVPWTF